MTELRIDGERLWQSLMTMAEIGATAKGGVCRLTLTDEDKRGRDLFRQWCEAAGLQVSIDQMGSMFARRAGTLCSIGKREAGRCQSGHTGQYKASSIHGDVEISVLWQGNCQVQSTG